MKRVGPFVFILSFVLAAVGSSFAQRSDRDNPLPVTSSEITGNLDDHNQETFYSFTAGPGEVTVTVDVKARHADIGNIAFEIIGRNGSTAIECCHGAQGDNGGTGRDVATFKLAKRQTVILHTTNGPVGGGTFRIRFGGAASFGGAPAASNGGNDRNGDEGDSAGHGNREVDQLDVPSSGTMHIWMKDGTVRDIDLSRVRNITVRQ